MSKKPVYNPSANLIEPVTNGDNGTRIYLYQDWYYLVDGEFDCRRDGRELSGEAWKRTRTLEEARATATAFL